MGRCKECGTKVPPPKMPMIHEGSAREWPWCKVCWMEFAPEDRDRLWQEFKEGKILPNP